MSLGWVAGAAIVGSAASGMYAANKAAKGQSKAIDAQSAAASEQAELGREQLGLAREEFALSKQRQAKFDPLYEQIIKASLASQTTQDDRSAQQFEQWEQEFMPAETKLARASLNYDTEGRRNDAAAAARAAVETQGAQARQAQTRGLNRAGISLSSGRALTLDRASRLDTSKAAAGADQAARRQVEATGLSLLDNVTKTGRGLTSTGLQAAGLALNAGNSAAGQLGQQQATYNGSMAPAMGLYGNAANANSSTASIYGNIAQQYGQQGQDAMSGLAGLGSLVGTIGSAGTGSIAGSLMGLSSKDFKEPIGKVSGKGARQALEGAPVERWKYKRGIADEGEHIGRYAEDIPGGPMGGKAIDILSELGLHHAAISDLSKEVKAMKAGKKKRGRSLADAEDVSYREVA